VPSPPSGLESHADRIDHKDIVVDAKLVDFVVSTLGIAQSTLTVTNGHAVFTPSPQFASLVWMQPPELHQLSLDIPEVTQSLSPLPDAHAIISHAQLDSIVIGLSQSTVTADLSVSGSVHVSSSFPVPDADIIVDKATLHVEVGIADERLYVSSADANIQDHVENCGLFGWCNGIVHHALPDLSQTIGMHVESIGNAFLGDPAIWMTTMRAVAQYVNLATPPSEPRWVVDPTSVTISGGAIRAKASRLWAPQAPTNCSAEVGCNLDVFVRCDIQHGAVELERQDATGWTGAGYDDGSNTQVFPSLTDARAQHGATNTYRVCGVNEAGRTCGSTFTADVGTMDICAYPVGPPPKPTCGARPLPPCHLPFTTTFAVAPAGEATRRPSGTSTAAAR
jgi:hypothetical protein